MMVQKETIRATERVRKSSAFVTLVRFGLVFVCFFFSLSARERATSMLNYWELFVPVWHREIEAIIGSSISQLWPGISFALIQSLK